MKKAHFIMLASLAALLFGANNLNAAGGRDEAHAAFARKDYSRAVQLYLPLAGQGDSDAQTRLGQIYEGGLGVPTDMGKALEWYNKAAMQNNAVAQTCLGFLFENGLGVKTNYQQALFWYNKAAIQGNARAQNNIGVMYLKGRGIEQNEERARYWFSLAAGQNLRQAKDNLEKLSPGPGRQERAPALESVKAAPVDIAKLAARGPGAQVADASRLAQNADASGRHPHEVRLFDIPLHYARRAEMRASVSTWPTSVLTAEGEDASCDRYDAARIMASASVLAICYEPDEYLKDLTYTFPVPQEHAQPNLLKVVEVKSIIAARYGEPDSVKGYRKQGPVQYAWNRGNIKITVERGWPDITVTLRYAVATEDGKPRQGRGEAF